MTDLRDKIAQIIAQQTYRSDKPVSFEEIADAIIAAMPEMVQPLVWQTVAGVRYVEDCVGDFTYNFDTSDRLPDEGIILYYRQDELTSDELWTEEDAKAAANRHHAAQIMQAFGVQGGP